MSSSTSSSKYTEAKVIGAVLLAVLALEVFSRQFASVLDYDRAHIHAFPEIVKSMGQANQPRVLIYGNSLVMHGVDDGLLSEELSKATSASASVSKISPVGTAVRDWIYLYDTYFAETEIHPEVVVVGFVAHHLSDHGELKMRRLARHFCSARNLPACLRDETNTFDERALGALSHVSAIYGDQQELQWGSVHWFIPEYSQGVRQINRFLDAKAGAEAKKNSDKNPELQPPAKTYQDITRLIAQFREHNVKAYFVPMPQPEIWDLDPALIETVESNGATLVDARAIAGMNDADFSDGYHLGESGREKLTRFLAEVLSAELKREE